MTGTRPWTEAHLAGEDPFRHRESDSRRNVWLGAVCVALLFGLLVEARLWRPGARFGLTENVQIGEAQAWWDGRLDLPERKWDSALKDGRVYSHFPPMFSIVSAAVTPLCGGAVPHWFIAFFLVMPVPILAYVLFLQRTGSAAYGVWLAIALTCGTSALPVLDKTLRGASPYFVNQTLAMIGLLILLIESFGRRRLWVAGVGLIIAALSRQMTIVYVIPLVWLAVRRGTGQQRRGRLVALGCTGVVVVGVPCLLNTLKFGHPLDSGYMHVYTDRAEDDFSRDAQTYGLFSTHYVARNLYHMNLGFPRLHYIQIAGAREVHLRPNRMGTGIWWTTPLLLCLFVDFRRIWREPLSRVWLATAGLAALGLLFYHSTGYDQRGFNRYSLDYVPVILALVAPRCFTGRRRWITLAMTVWSVVYFRWLI